MPSSVFVPNAMTQSSSLHAARKLCHGQTSSRGHQASKLQSNAMQQFLESWCLPKALPKARTKAKPGYAVVFVCSALPLAHSHCACMYLYTHTQQSSLPAGSEATDVTGLYI